MSFKNRWMIRGILTTTTPLHIGNGETVSRSGLLGAEKEPVLIQAVATDFQGRAYIPGSAIKGNLRAWLERSGSPVVLMEKLFGSRDQQKVDAQGGCVEFWDARAVRVEDIPLTPPHWDPDRLTGVVASVAINRQTRSAADNKLFHQEYVPPGIGFEVTITGQNLEDEDVALLLNGLERGCAGDDPMLLGAVSANNWGRCSWERSEIRFLDATGVKRWISGGAGTVGYTALEPLSEDKVNALLGLARGYPASGNGCRLVVNVTLAFDAPFLVNDRLRVSDDTDDHLPRRNEEGRIVLPASSFRGALRSQAERIIRTHSAEACGPESPCKPINEILQAADELCPACSIFGAGGWQSLLHISDFIAVTEPQILRQEFVAIDRFTGGAANKKKFNARSALNPVLKGTITLNPAKLTPSDLGLLVLLFRDLIEGDITFGFGSAKGYGACRAGVDVTIPHVSRAALDKYGLLQIVESVGYEMPEATSWQPEPIEDERTRNLLTVLVDAFSTRMAEEVTHA